ncbi:DUF4244 domain-containing protein [Haloactinomyces albus]|uniref:DUF4244 domain-containing protein n=1 Tax=Haloactinomyces albus TaxID=1352928 RepID=A0AAE3ZDT3_9ACTN|nr:DUF4244 domain-containing protein [Haloactinomyces albus]MDR7301714.1 hypothetical protein [Haloactinomyces albus]
MEIRKSVPETLLRPAPLKSRPSGRRLSKLRALLHGDDGMSTAEYAIGTLAAAAFAALLYTVLTGDAVTEALTSLIQRALESGLR